MDLLAKNPDLKSPSLFDYIIRRWGSLFPTTPFGSFLRCLAFCQCPLLENIMKFFAGLLTVPIRLMKQI